MQINILKSLTLIVTVILLTSCGGGGGESAGSSESVNQKNTYDNAGRWSSQGWSGGAFSGLPADVIADVMSEYADVPPPVRPNHPDDLIPFNLGLYCPYDNTEAFDEACDFYFAHCDDVMSVYRDNFTFRLIYEECRNDSGEQHGYSQYFTGSNNELSLSIHYENGVWFGPVLSYADEWPGLGLFKNYRKNLYFVKRDGTRHGPEITYWPSRSYGELPVAKLEFFIDGALEGNSIEYWPNGSIKVQANYVNGLCEGDYLQYYPNGEIRMKGRCESGNITGSFEYYSAVSTGNYNGGVRNFDDYDYNEYWVKLLMQELYPNSNWNIDESKAYKYAVVQKVVGSLSNTEFRQWNDHTPKIGLLHGSFSRYEIIDPLGIGVDPYNIDNQILIEQAELDQGVFTGLFTRWARTAEDPLTSRVWREGTYTSKDEAVITEYDASGVRVFRGGVTDLYGDYDDANFLDGWSYNWEQKFTPFVDPVVAWEGTTYGIPVGFSFLDRSVPNGLPTGFTASLYTILMREAWVTKVDIGTYPVSADIQVERKGSLVNKPLTLLGTTEKVVILGLNSVSPVDVDEESGLVLAVDDSDNIIFIGKSVAGGSVTLNATSTAQFLLEVNPGIKEINVQFGFAEIQAQVPEIQVLITLVDLRVENSPTSWSDPNDTEFLDALAAAVNAMYQYADSAAQAAAASASSGVLAALSVNYVATPSELQSGIGLSSYTGDADALELVINNNYKRWLNVYVGNETKPYLLKPGSRNSLMFGSYLDGTQVELYGLGKGDFLAHDANRWLPPVVADYALTYALPVLSEVTGSSFCVKTFLAPDGVGGWAAFLAAVSNDPDFVSAVKADEYTAATVFATREMTRFLVSQSLDGTFGCLGDAFAKQAFKRLAAYLVPGLGSVTFAYKLAKATVTIYPAMRDAFRSNLYESWDILNLDLDLYAGTWQLSYTLKNEYTSPSGTCQDTFDSFENTFSINGNSFLKYIDGRQEWSINAWGFGPVPGLAQFNELVYGELDRFGDLYLEKWYSGGAVQIQRKMTGRISSNDELAGTFSAFNGNNFTGVGRFCDADFTAIKISDSVGDIPPGVN